jgi:hypothetical protein
LAETFHPFIARNNLNTLTHGMVIRVGERSKTLLTFAYVSDDGKMIATQEPGEKIRLNHVENCVDVTVVPNPNHWRNALADHVAKLDAIGEISLDVRNWFITRLRRGVSWDELTAKLVAIGDAARH